MSKPNFETDKRFINPYNFVSLEGTCERKSIETIMKNEGERYTGYLTCTLKTLTPIFIPNTSCDKAFQQEGSQESKSYDFFSYDNLSDCAPGERNNQYSVPIIPGSEIRGMIRSVYEAAFKGCLSQVNLKKHFHRRSDDQKIAGILRKNGDQWEIKPCERVMLNTSSKKKEKSFGEFINDENLEEGAVVFIKKSAYRYKKSNKCSMPHIAEAVKVTSKKPDTTDNQEWIKGYFHKGEAFSRKHHESVFVEKNGDSIPVPDEEMKRLELLLEQYGDNKINRHLDDKKHTGYKAYKEKFKSVINHGNGQLLVYYSEVQCENNGKYDKVPAFLTPAQLSKEVFLNTLEDILKSQGGYQPCTSREHVCPACALFGTVSENTGESLASRIRFTDATALQGEREAKNYYIDPIILPEMGEPKPGTVEFYTVPPYPEDNSSKRFWTYDYKKVGHSRTFLTPEEIKIRGRKFYWHSNNWQSLLNSREGSSKNGNKKMIQKIRPVAAEKYFHFQIYFDQISKEELSRLKWVLDFGDENCAHKIGRGKPLGLGSVRINVQTITLRRICPTTGRWNIIEYSDTNPSLPISQLVESQLESKAMKEIKKIMNFSRLLTANVTYPIGSDGKKSKNSNASHQWFSLNKQKKMFNKALPTIDQELGSDRKKWLYELHRSQHNDSSAKGRNKSSYNK
jgi:CRISPR-associated protein (TIGR03986 family)